MALIDPPPNTILNLAPDWPALADAVQALPDAVALTGFDPLSNESWPNLVVLSLDQPVAWGCTHLEELLTRFPQLGPRLVTCQAADSAPARAKTLSLGGLGHWQFCSDPARLAERLQTVFEISRLRADQGLMREALSKIGVSTAELAGNLRYQVVNSAYANEVARA